MRIVVLLVLLCLGGCAKDLTGSEPTTRVSGLLEPKITYLGVGGWLLHWKGESLLFAPSFSNPAFPPVFVSANQSRIDRYMPESANTTAVLIGHAHYDHLMDVPWIIQRHAPKATAYGSTTAGHILAGAKPAPRFVDMERKMVPVMCGSRACPQVNPQEKWERAGHFRFMAIESQHAPHFAGIDLLPGSYGADLDDLPTYVRAWREGTTLAWLVDLLDEQGEPVYRIHYQDSASNPPYGFPPILQDGKGVDAAIICAASTDQVAQYPDALLKVLKPRLLLIGHWEDFFGNDPERPQLIRLQGHQQVELAGRLRKAYPNTVMPYPLTEVALPPPE
ncbi:MBL fold metallo-hydrolase [Pseudomonas sp. Q1-7]|uniref:MBL fold metallo-hydrolase n=1 Tax=Pseudomonas sp. Q1-7 TaxID=3020843 RepID=UPI002300EADE|nr:hypothetical protein [Pseudomonas sp. Q1-7]